MHYLSCFITGSFLWAGLLPTAALAATDCLQTAQTQAEMTQCAGQKYKAADARLNQQYQALVSRLAERPDQKTQLVTTQRRWLAFRDAECRFTASAVVGASAQPMVRLLCLTRLTSHRNAQLDYYLSCEEGDMSCPAPNAGAAQQPSDRPTAPTQ